MKSTMKKTIAFALSALALSSAALAALPAPSDIQKDGDCPVHYAAKGSQCVPGPNAIYAMTKHGNCPEGYSAQGNYCVGSEGAKLAIRKAAMSCPSGFAEIGSYCVSEK